MSDDDATPREIYDTPSSAIWRKLGDHDARLGNGRERFQELAESNQELREEIRDIHRKLAPKPIRWWAVIGAGLGGAVTIFSIVWTLASQISSLEEGLRSLGRSVEELRVDVRSLRDR